MKKTGFCGCNVFIAMMLRLENISQDPIYEFTDKLDG